MSSSAQGNERPVILLQAAMGVGVELTVQGWVGFERDSGPPRGIEALQAELRPDTLALWREGAATGFCTREWWVGWPTATLVALQVAVWVPAKGGGYLEFFVVLTGATVCVFATDGYSAERDEWYALLAEQSAGALRVPSTRRGGADA